MIDLVDPFVLLLIGVGMMCGVVVVALCVLGNVARSAVALCHREDPCVGEENESDQGEVL